jgi:hypothetical protein
MKKLFIIFIFILSFISIKAQQLYIEENGKISLTHT